MELDTQEYMQRRFYYHCYEAHELAFLERWLRRGDRMIDIGAHVGLFTLVGARLVGPGGRVDAFEPVPATHEKLLRNVALNHYSWVHPQRAAVTDHAGDVSLGIPEERLVGQSVAEFTIGATLNAVDAPAVTLDEYVDDDMPVRLLKIDAEGSERNILAGAHQLTRAQPAFRDSAGTQSRDADGSWDLDYLSHVDAHRRWLPPPHAGPTRTPRARTERIEGDRGGRPV